MQQDIVQRNKVLGMRLFRKFFGYTAFSNPVFTSGSTIAKQNETKQKGKAKKCMVPGM